MIWQTRFAASPHSVVPLSPPQAPGRAFPPVALAVFFLFFFRTHEGRGSIRPLGAFAVGKACRCKASLKPF